MRANGLMILVGLIVFGLVVGAISPLTPVLLIAYAAITWSLARLVLTPERALQHMTVFTVYAFAALAIYLAQLWTLPSYYGFSGGFGVGTDDSFFYSLVARTLPDEFPLRAGNYIPEHSYADLLRIPARLVWALGGTLHPLDLLLFNAAGLAALPSMTRELGERVGLDARSAGLAFLLMAVCPFTAINGLVLVRDGWQAVFFTGCLLAVVTRRWPVAGALAAGTFWMREGSGLLLIGTASLLVFAGERCWTKYAQPQRMIIARVFLIGFLSLVVVGVVARLSGSNELSFFRSDYIASTLVRSVNVDKGTSTFYALMSLPPYLRTPLTFVFFWGSPFLSLGSLSSDGVWIPRMVLSNLFSIFFFFYASWFLRGTLRVVKDRRPGMVLVLIAFMAGVLILSQASMQLRHKTVMMPLFYLVTAAGVTSPYVSLRALGWAFTLALFVFSGVLNVYQLF